MYQRWQNELNFGKSFFGVFIWSVNRLKNYKVGLILSSAFLKEEEEEKKHGEIYSTPEFVHVNDLVRYRPLNFPLGSTCWRFRLPLHSSSQMERIENQISNDAEDAQIEAAAAAAAVVMGHEAMCSLYPFPWQPLERLWPITAFGTSQTHITELCTLNGAQKPSKGTSKLSERVHEITELSMKSQYCLWDHSCVTKVSQYCTAHHRFDSAIENHAFCTQKQLVKGLKCTKPGPMSPIKTAIKLTGLIFILAKYYLPDKHDINLDTIIQYMVWCAGVQVISFDSILFPISLFCPYIYMALFACYLDREKFLYTYSQKFHITTKSLLQIIWYPYIYIYELQAVKIIILENNLGVLFYKDLF